jgi:large subunit ribosomal protein L21
MSGGYAIVEAGGRQWRVEPGTQFRVNRLDAAVGSQHVIDRVLLADNGTTVRIGQPYLPGAKVLCEVLEQAKGPKVITYKFRRRENYRKTVGHRQQLTKLLVKDIELAE